MPEPKKIEVEESMLTGLMDEMKSMKDSISTLNTKSEILEKENKELKSNQNTANNTENVIEEQDFTPKSLQIRTYKNFPIVKIKSYLIDDKNKQGETITMCEIENSNGDKAKMRLEGGYIGGDDNFYKLPIVEYPLCDVDSRDKTGASRIEMNTVVANTGQVEYVRRDNDKTVNTGNIVNQLVKKDIRYYTILVGEDKLELNQDNIIR